MAPPASRQPAAGGPASDRLLHAAFMLLSIPSFLIANSLWAEMAALVRTTPEGNHLATYLLFALQASNVFPAIIMLESKLLARCFPLETAIWLQLVCGFLAAQAISLFWDRTSRARSVALIFLVFLAGAVNNSSSLCLYPYVSRWPRRFITDVAVGEGLSGPLVSVLALVQDVGGSKPRFSTRVYYQLVSLLYGPALLAYVFLLRREAAEGVVAPPSVEAEAQGVGRYKPMPTVLDGESDDEGEQEQEEDGAAAATVWVSPGVVFRRILPFLAVQFVVAGLAYGVLPAIMPIAVTGYHDSAHVLQFSSFFSMFMDPAARFATHYVRVYRLLPIFSLVLALASVIIAAAAASPHPPLAGLKGGGALVVVTNACFTASFAFCSTMVYFATHRRLSCPAGTAAAPLILADEGHESGTGPSSGRERPLMVGGCDEGGEEEWRARVVQRQRQQGFKQSAFAVQVGAFVGASVTWVLVVFTKDRQ